MAEKGRAKDLVQITVNAYGEDKLGPSYVESQHNFDMSKSRNYFLSLVTGNRILDVGCGTGRDAQAFAKQGYDVVGIDATPYLLKRARMLAPDAQIMHMDMRNLIFPNETFDGLWACASFLHIPKKEAQKTLNGFRRVLTKNGVMFMCIMEGEGERVEQDGRFFSYYQQDEIRGLVEKAGFQLHSALSIEKDAGKVWIPLYAFAKAQ